MKLTRNIFSISRIWSIVIAKFMLLLLLTAAAKAGAAKAGAVNLKKDQKD